MKQQRGYVALLDVLGFTAIVSGEGHPENLSRYVTSLNEVTNQTEVEIVLFSDTIVMTSLGDVDESLVALLGICSHAFGLLLSQEIAVRGAISYGSFIRYKNPKGTFLAGRAIIDAYRFQQKQDWVGIMLAPSVLDKLPDLGNRCSMPPQTPCTVEQLDEFSGRFPWALNVQNCEGIPFHTSDPSEPQKYEGFAVVPTDTTINDPKSMIENLNRALDRVDRLKSLAPDPRSQKKYSEARVWLGKVKGKWQGIQHSMETHGVDPFTERAAERA